jgi:outer membrane receptor protein involved in Fe transport
MRRFPVFILSLWLLPLCLYSQGQMRGPGIVTGRIIDSRTGQPVEYSNVLLMDTVTKAMVSGVVSDSTGSFRLNNVPLGNYYLEYSFIGYDRQHSKPFAITKSDSRIDLGMMKLAPSGINMDEVTITGERSMMINKIDRKVFNVEKDIAAQTGTVTDLLQNIPSVSVDMEGNVSLRGSGSVTILINGRPSVMSNAATLQQMPASMIEKIEVITNPSAKYKPDGTAGIINIILKKERKAGFNGSLSANAGNNDRYNTTLQLNMNTGNFNLFGSYGFRQDYRQRTGELYSETIDTTGSQPLSTYLWQTSRGFARPISHLAQLGADWNITPKNAVGITGTYNYRKVQRDDITSNLYKDTDLNPTEEFTRTGTGYDDENSYGMTAFYEHTFNKEQEHIFRIDFEYQSDGENENYDYVTRYAIPDYPDELDNNQGDNREQNINLTLGYSRPLWENASLETGYEGTMQITDQNAYVSHFNPESGLWVPDPEQNNLYHANQAVHALYGTVAYGWKKFSVMGGLRAELALVNLDFKTLDTTAVNNYFAVYPTLHMSLESGKNEWQLNYSSRVNRPDGEDMNPVPEYRDPRNIFVGNPDLKPENIHSFEFGYAVRLKNASLIPSLFYRYKMNGFTMVTTSLNDTVLETTIDNLNHDQSAGIDFSGTWTLLKIINLNFSLSGFYSQIDASDIGYSSTKSAFAWNSKLNASVNITKTTLFQVNTQYRSKALTAQGMRQPTWFMNLGFRQDFWKKKISVLLTVSDLFNSMAWKNSIDTPVLIQESTRRRDARVFYAGLVFNFGVNGKKTKDVKLEYDNGMDK